jgi:hypothetical protein
MKLRSDSEATSFVTARSPGISQGEPFIWSILVPKLLNPAQVIIIEAMMWVERPMSASELGQIAGGDPVLSTFSYHLRKLATLGVLEVVGKLKVRKSRSSNKETFFYFTGEREWIARIGASRDPDDPLTKVALSLAAT